MLLHTQILFVSSRDVYIRRLFISVIRSINVIAWLHARTDWLREDRGTGHFVDD